MNYADDRIDTFEENMNYAHDRSGAFFAPDLFDEKWGSIGAQQRLIRMVTSETVNFGVSFVQIMPLVVANLRK